MFRSIFLGKKNGKNCQNGLTRVFTFRPKDRTERFSKITDIFNGDLLGERAYRVSGLYLERFRRSRDFELSRVKVRAHNVITGEPRFKKKIITFVRNNIF